jgi:hypothetical protein
LVLVELLVHLVVQELQVEMVVLVELLTLVQNYTLMVVVVDEVVLYLP